MKKLSTAEIEKKLNELSENFSKRVSWSAANISQILNASLATNFAESTDRYLRALFESAPTVYDKAMDAWREVSGHLSYDHRIFDGGHGVADAWSAVKNALPNDTFREETLGYLEAYWKDLVTPMGMPVLTLNKDNFDWVANAASSLGVERGYLLDLVSFTATEGAGALGAVVGASLNWKKSEIEKFSEHASSIALGSAMAANPLALTVSVLLLARSYHVGREEGRIRSVLNQFGWGAGKTAAFIGAASIVGGTAWLGVVTGITAAVVVDKIKARYSEEDEIYSAEFMAENLARTLPNQVSKLIESKSQRARN